MALNKLQELPHDFQKKYSEKKDCGCFKKETITYQLTLEFCGGCDFYGEYKKRYKLYYKPKTNLYWRNNPPVIGEHLGLGAEIDELGELIDNLKSKIK
jgi:hypothetical protein